MRQTTAYPSVPDRSEIEQAHSRFTQRSQLDVHAKDDDVAQVRFKYTDGRKTRRFGGTTDRWTLFW